MIKHLSIRNYAIIRQLDIDFSEKLTIITGETGAGKSILLGALGLILGRRADSKSLLSRDRKCIVEGTFDIKKYHLKTFFIQNELDYEEETIIRREITTSGKSRAFVNDTPVTLKVLENLSGSLIDIHQQFDNLDIHQVSFQLRILDALARNKQMLEHYQELFEQYKSNLEELNALQNQEYQASKEKDYISFQINEFEQAHLQEGELATFEEEMNQLNHAEEIQQIVGQTLYALSEGDRNIIDEMKSLLSQLQKAGDFSTGLQKLAERFAVLMVELEDFAQEISNTSGGLDADPSRLEMLSSKLDIIYRLMKKHNVQSEEELIATYKQLSQQVAGYDSLEEKIIEIKKRITTEKNTLEEIASTLSKKRKEVVDGFLGEIHSMLSELSMPHARLKISIEQTENLTNTGSDKVEFLFSTNKGNDFLPIKKVASGGELSRLTLCAKSFVASSIPLPTLVFDEVDTGISGEIARKMGTILNKLSNKHQLIAITHTPQVAVNADVHYSVYKEEEGDTIATKVKKLNFEDRIYVVATMLSGDPPSPSAIENAKALLRLDKD